MVHRVVTLKAQGIDHLLTFEFHQDGHREVCKVTERLNGRVIDVDSFSAQYCEETIASCKREHFKEVPVTSGLIEPVASRD